MSKVESFDWAGQGRREAKFQFLILDKQDTHGHPFQSIIQIQFHRLLDF
jgi:hypothetical protein